MADQNSGNSRRVNPYEYCPECHNKMTMATEYSEYSCQIGETVTVRNCRPYLACPNGCVAHVPGEVCMDEYGEQVQRRIEEWVMHGIGSFEDLSAHFYTRRQAVAHIRKMSGEIQCNDERFNPAIIKRDLDWFCFHVRICGQNFYLKKSLEKYCQTGKGWFSLSEGF